MAEIQSLLALSATFTTFPGGQYAIAARECYPTYIPGTTYSIGTWILSSITSTTPILTYREHSPLGKDFSPPSRFVYEGGVTTTELYNYKCHSEYWCSVSGYSPDLIYAEYAWMKESTECMV